MEDIIGGVIAFVGVVVFVTLFMTLPVLVLWNWLMPEIFGLTTITFWQAAGIVALSSMLFKSSARSSS